MSQSRFWTVLALLSALVLAGFPAGVDAQSSSAAAPAAMSVSGANFDAQTSAVDVATDPSGRYAVVATTAPQGEVVESTTHLYAYDMLSGTFLNTGVVRYPYGFPEQPPALGGVVAIQESSSPGKYVVGAGKRIQIYNMGGTLALTSQQVYRDTGASANVVAVAMNADATRVVAAINHATPISGVTMENQASAFSNITIFDGSLGVRWRAVFPSAITAMAVRANIVAVTTETHLYVFHDWATFQPTSTVRKCDDAVKCKAYQIASSTSTERANTLRLSPNGAWLLLGTDKGNAYLFRTTDATLAAGQRSAPGHPGDGAIRGMAMNVDASGAPTLFGVVWDNGNLRVYRHDPAAALTGTPVTTVYLAKVPGTGTAGGTGKPAGLSMSLSNPFGASAAPYPYLVVPVGSAIHGFTTAPPASGAKAAAWTIDAGSAVVEASITTDAERIVAVAAGKMMGFKQITRAAIIPKTFLEGGITRPLVGKTAVPGTIVNYQFDLKNDGTTDDNYTFPWSVQPPNGWTDQGRDGIGLRAGERATISFNVTVPSEAQPTSHAFTLLVHSRLKGTSNVCGAEANRPCAIQFFANVTRVSRIEVIPTTESMRNLTLTAGQATEFSFDVRNRGNARTFPVNISLAQKPSSGSPWNVTLDRQFNLALDGGGSVRVTGRVTPPPSALNGQFTVIEVSALVNDTAVGAPLKLKALLNPNYGVQLSTEKPLFQLPAGRTPILVKVQNTGNTEQTVQLSFNITPRAALDKDYRLEAPTFTVTLPEAGKSKTWTLYVSPVAEFPDQATITVDAFVRESATKKDSLTINIERLPEDIPPCDSIWCRLTPGPGALLGALAAVGAAVLVQRKR